MSDTTLAEVAVLGILMAHPDQAAPDVYALVKPTDFTGPHVLVAEAIYGLRVKRLPIDPMSVGQEMKRRSTLTRVGGMAFVESVSRYTALAALDSYLAEIVAAKRLRMLNESAAKVQQWTAADHDPAELAQYMVNAGQAVLDAAMTDEDIDTPTLDEFLSGQDPEYDWIVPGVLERSDRLILTGSEGLGKSTLFRQLAVTIAAGIHPFRHTPIPPQRVLYVDCENGATHMRRKLRPLAIQAKLQGHGAGQTLFVEGRPEGLNLLSPAGQNWLLRRVSALQPAALFTGSLYKMFEGDPIKEEPARGVASVLDRCRAAANCAIVVEAHSGHATGMAGERHVRPIGASLWLRWPEFGYGLRATKDFNPDTRLVDFVPWRGDRDEREWPKRLQAGRIWPWEVATYSAHNDAGAA